MKKGTQPTCYPHVCRTLCKTKEILMRVFGIEFDNKKHRGAFTFYKEGEGIESCCIVVYVNDMRKYDIKNVGKNIWGFLNRHSPRLMDCPLKFEHEMYGLSHRKQ